MPPRVAPDRHPNTMLGVSIACCLMAAIVYYHLEASRASSSPAASKAQIASVTPRPSTSIIAPERTARSERLPSRAPDGDREIWAKVDSRPESKAENQPEPLSQHTVTLQATSASQHESVAMLRPAVAGAQGVPSRSAVRTLDPEEISLLITQGEKHISTGDVVTARMIFQRAAEAGDATAALALAATYDPTVLAKLGVMGMGADVEKARTWYQMAESFGSAEAKQRRELLDKR
jgi:hypothetical protein